MFVPLPNLDDRRWTDLVEEGRALVPLHAPEWTDHNIHDPGITLIELLAWLAEMDIYQLNRIAERHRRKFLALVGLEPRPVRASRTVLSFRPSATAPEPLVLQEGTEFTGIDPFGEVTPFRVLESLRITHAKPVGVYSVTEQGRQDLTDAWNRRATFEPFGPLARKGSEFQLVFDQPLPIGGPVNLHFKLGNDRAGDEERARVFLEAGEFIRNCGPNRGPACPRPEVMSLPAGSIPLPVHHSVRLVWEYFAESRPVSRWMPLDADRGEIDDGTRSLTLDGLVRLAAPGAMAGLPGRQGATPSYAVRCRIERGTYDAAPVVAGMAFNAVEAEQAVPVGSATETSSGKVQAALLGAGNGRPWQQFDLQELSLPYPVQPSSLQIFTREGTRWKEWQRRHDFDASGRADAHYVLEPSARVIRFGDGETGRVPPVSGAIYAAYRATRAQAGNLRSHTIRDLSDSMQNQTLFGSEGALRAGGQAFDVIDNSIPAAGGSDEESLAEAEARAIALVEMPQVAVTLADFEALALDTPGTRLARVAAVANLHPSFPCFRAPGLVTLIVVPYLPPARPTPSAGLCHAVAAYLGRRRVVGTRVEVVAPGYLEVTVRASVRAVGLSDKSAVKQRVVDALNSFLHPLKGGEEGSGWPFGRDVYRTEILQLISRTSGIEHVLQLELAGPDGIAQCGNICLPPTWLVTSGQHAIEVL